MCHCFVDLQRDKRLYDSGQPVFYTLKGGGMLPDQAYGESAFPPGYFARAFALLFDVIGSEFEDTTKDQDQVTIALRKRDSVPERSES